MDLSSLTHGYTKKLIKTEPNSFLYPQRMQVKSDWSRPVKRRSMMHLQSFGLLLIELPKIPPLVDSDYSQLVLSECLWRTLRTEIRNSCESYWSKKSKSSINLRSTTYRNPQGVLHVSKPSATFFEERTGLIVRYRTPEKTNYMLIAFNLLEKYWPARTLNKNLQDLYCFRPVDNDKYADRLKNNHVNVEYELETEWLHSWNKYSPCWPNRASL